MLLEPIETLNKRLLEHFGTSWDNQAIWRIVFSDDQFEKRMMDVTDKGIHLLVPEVREVPKYRQWIHHKYVLERLVTVPEINQNEVLSKISYEPIYVFEDRHGNPLPPKWEAAKFIVDSVYAAMGKSSLAKYTDPEGTPEGAIEEKDRRIKDLEESLFGNETETGDALAHKQAVVVPRNYNKQDKQVH